MLGYEGMEVINPEGGKDDAEEEAQRGRWKQEERDSYWKMMYKYIGSDVTSMVTLPVLIFEPMTMIQKMAELMEYSYLLDQADECEDPYMRRINKSEEDILVPPLFQSAALWVNVYVPKDRVTNLHQGYGFVEFRSKDDADYAIKVLNMIKLYGKPIRVNKAYQDKKSLDVGANLFVGHLDPDVDEKLLYDTFSAFGVIVTNPKVVFDFVLLLGHLLLFWEQSELIFLYFSGTYILQERERKSICILR